MNPIIEEEDSDSQSPKGESSIPLSSSRRLYVAPGALPDFSDFATDLSDESNPGAVSDLPKPDNVNKWLEFKSAPVRMTEGATNQEAFPVLVRRLEIDGSPMRKNSIGKDQAAAAKRDYEESPRRGESANFSLGASEFIKFDKQKSFDSDEEEKTRQEDGLPPVRMGPSPVDKVLEYQRQGKHSPEDLLLMAISEQDNPGQGRRLSIWAKLGSRLRPEETFATVIPTKAMTEWERLKDRLSELAEEKQSMLDDIEAMKQEKAEQTQKSAEITGAINEVSAEMKHVRKSRKAARDSYQRESELQTQFHSQLLEDQQATAKDCADHIDASREAEERWLSRIEELLQILLTFETDRKTAFSESQAFSSLVPDVVSARARLEEERRETEMCLELLGETMEYFARSQEHIQMNVNSSVGRLLRLTESAAQGDVRRD